MRSVFIAAATATMAFVGTAQAGLLDDVKAKGFIQCGVNTGLTGFSAPNDQGKWEGFDVDFCRAISAAVFGDPDKVKYTPLTSKERFTAVQSGEVDVLSRNTTWTFTRDVNLGLEFIGVNYYDGQGFMIRKNMGIKSAKELDGARPCILHPMPYSKRSARAACSHPTSRHTYVLLDVLRRLRVSSGRRG